MSYNLTEDERTHRAFRLLRTHRAFRLLRTQRATTEANARFAFQPKQNVGQLAKLARRIPRVVRRNTQRLMKKGLTPNEVNECKFKIHGAQAAAGLLNQALIERNIGGLPYRDCTPHLKRAPGHKTPMPLMRAA